MMPVLARLAMICAVPCFLAGCVNVDCRLKCSLVVAITDEEGQAVDGAHAFLLAEVAEYHRPISETAVSAEGRLRIQGQMMYGGETFLPLFFWYSPPKPRLFLAVQKQGFLPSIQEVTKEAFSSRGQVVSVNATLVEARSVHGSER